MKAASAVLLVSQEPQTVRIVSDTLGASEDLAHQATYETMDDMVLALDRERISAVIVDIDPRPLEALRELHAIAEQFPATRFIVVSSDQREDLIVSAMQAGVRHVLKKREVASQLLPALQRIVPSGYSRNGGWGTIVSVFSAGGGCGATVFAVNLANELGLKSKHASLLVDMDLDYGGAAGYLGTTGDYGIADVLSDGSRIDAPLIRSTAVTHNEHLHVLVSPATIRPGEATSLHDENLRRALQRARETYPYVVVDAPRHSFAVLESLALASSTIYLILELNVQDIRYAKRMYWDLVARGIDAERIHPIANRYRGRRELISLKEVAETIGCKNVDRLSNDFKGVSTSLNFGRLMSESAPRSAFRTDIIRCAEAVQEVGRRKKSESTGKS